MSNIPTEQGKPENKWAHGNEKTEIYTWLYLTNLLFIHKLFQEYYYEITNIKKYF